MKKKVTSILFAVVIVSQGMQIISSLINIIYCFITGSTSLFWFSNPSLLVPQYYLSNGYGWWNIFPLIVFFGVNVFLYIKATSWIVRKSEKMEIFVGMNMFWQGICEAFFLAFFTPLCYGEHYSSVPNMFINIAILYTFGIAVCLRMGYPKNYFQYFHPRNFKELQACAYSNVMISIIGLILHLWMHYFADTPLSNPNHNSLLDFDLLYSVFLMMNVIMFVFVLVENARLKKQLNEFEMKPITKLVVMQLTAMLIEIIGMYLIAFVIF